MFFDCHAHTAMSYCAEPSMRTDLYLDALGKGGDVGRVAITDHTMAVYFPKDVAWSWRYMTDSKVYDAHREFGNARLAAHFEALSKLRPRGVLKGLETEMMHDGRFDFDPAFRKDLDLLIGSVHWLPVNRESCGDSGLIARHWLDHTLKLLDSGVDVLGHPFRWLSSHVSSVDSALIRLVVSHAKAAGVALELNSHYRIGTDAEMLRVVMETGATLALGSDSHRPDEILDLSYHKGLFASLGIDPAALKLFRVA